MSLWRDPDDVSHCRILSPDKTEWRLISATLCGRRRCFAADQLWFMTRIREEEVLTYCSCRRDAACDPCVHRLVAGDSLTSETTRRQSSVSRRYTSHCRPAAVLAAPTATQQSHQRDTWCWLHYENNGTTDTHQSCTICN